MPAPLAPSTATRSPKSTSRSNGSVSPSSSSCSTTSARLPVRAPPRRMAMRCSRTSAGRSSRSTNWRRRLSAAFSLGAKTSQYRARRRISATSVLEALALLVVEGAVLVELVEVGPAGVGVAGEAAAERPRPAARPPTARALDRDDLRRRGGEQLAVVADVQHGLARRSQLPSSHRLASTSRKLSGSSSSSTSASLRSSTSRARRFCSPPDSVRSGRRGDLVEGQADGTRACTRSSAPRRGSRRHRPMRPRRGRSASDRRSPRPRQPPDRRGPVAAPPGRATRAAGGPSRGVGRRVGEADELAHDADPTVDGDRPARRRRIAGDEGEAASTCRPRWRRRGRRARRRRP